jgi:serpin B
MTSAGARGKTLEEMEQTLHFTLNREKLPQAFQELIDTLNGDPKTRKYQLSVANALWAQKGLQFVPHFVRVTEDNYHAGLKEVDFARETDKSRQTINHWVEEQTKDKIKDLIKPGVLQSDTLLVLTNAIYFKAAWAEPFHEYATKNADFHRADGGKVRDVPMMHKVQDCPYVEGDGFQAVELPYQNGQLSLVVILPKDAAGLANLEKDITAEDLAKWREKQKTHSVDLTLPRFKVTAEFELSKTLAAMGMPLAFSNAADFSGITRSEPLKISKVIHKAYVDLNEKGTEAAAATAVVAVRASAVQPPKPKVTFKADHPFVFLIRENGTNSILFMGWLADPLAK